MNRLKLFGMNAKQSWFVVVFFLIDLLVIGLVVLTVIFGWDYTIALLSGIWQFVTVGIPRMIIAAVSALVTVILGILYFLASLGGKPGRFPSPGFPFRRGYRFPQPKLSSPSPYKTSIRLPGIKLPGMTRSRKIETSVPLAEIKLPEIAGLTSVDCSPEPTGIEPLEITSITSVETCPEPTGIEPPEVESYLSRLLKLLRKLEIKWPHIDWGSGQGSGWPSGYYRSTHVRGYFRRDGTYVSGHSRRGYYRRSRRW
ncbi:MAG TPA: hypothetical protein PKD55_17765 [Bellilinea sp.]|nr:hypothetical protein [Bellilinea sp.]